MGKRLKKTADRVVSKRFWHIMLNCRAEKKLIPHITSQKQKSKPSGVYTSKTRRERAMLL